jgi:protein Tex
MDAAIIVRIAQETAIPENSVAVTVSLFEKGATGPFIVHYRKEVTGGLDEAKVRLIQERMAHYREVYDQRAALLKFLSEQGKLTDELRAKIESCFTKPELDDLHHQFRLRRKTRSAEAIEKGLEPLAEYFWNQEADAWGAEEHINVFVDPAKGVSTREQALQGVVDIIAEWIWANFEYRKALREMLWSEGFVVSTVVPAKVGQKTKYNMYYERRESVTSIPSHRVLAIRRGCKEGILISSIEGDASKAIEFLINAVIKDKESIFAPILEVAVRESYNRILRPLIETEVRTQLKERADREAIRVFQENLSNLLLSPPAGPIMVMGIDWGKGDECSVAIVNEAGSFLEGAKIRLTAEPLPAAKPEAKTPEPATAPEEHGSEEPATEPLPEISAAPENPVDPGAAPPNEPATPVPTEETAAIAAGVGTDGPAVPESAAIMDNPPIAPLVESSSETPSPISLEPAAVEPEVVETAPTEPAVVEPEIAETAPTEPAAAENQAGPGTQTSDPRKILSDLIRKHHVTAISIGSGMGARELETALHQIVSEENLGDILIAAVNDAGIAIYSSSRIAREEFPDWSASARCAVSLARRLQDPLAELVKIDPKLIGVGQYQHDVDQKELHRGLVQTVQYCVNKVGANVNTAGESLLRYVSGLNEKLARRIVAYRTAQGRFISRPAIKSAVGMDDSTYEQAAAFLRISDGENALDRTAVHPESYPIVDKIVATLGIATPDLIGNRDVVSSIKMEEFATETAGIPTLQDIREELLRPGRDPRKSFKIPKFRADVKEMADLKPGMALEGTVTNVTNFGAFIDIGVRQDGLVHLSQMSNRFIRDPREAVKVGDVVQVKVISVEPETKRIGLSMKALLSSGQRRRKKQPKRPQKPAAIAHNPETAAAGETAGTEAAASFSPVEKRAPQTNHPKQHGPHEGQARFRKKFPRKPEKIEEPGKQIEPSPTLPEPSLQEKIAILQSKFRGIN